MIDENDFYITLPSNNKSHKDNSTSQFRVTLPRQLTLPGKWEVSMTEISFPFTWFNVDSANSSSSRIPDGMCFMVFRNGKTVPLAIPSGSYPSAKFLIQAMKRAIEKQGLQGHISFQYDTVFNQFLFSIDKKSPVVHVVLSDKLKYIMGFSQNVLDKPYIIAKYPPDFRGSIDHMYVYSNIVQPTIVGDSYEQLLRIVNVTCENNAFGTYVEKIYTMPYYVPVLMRQLDTITISINTDQNVPVNFMYGKVVVKLHFRKVRVSLFE